MQHMKDKRPDTSQPRKGNFATTTVDLEDTVPPVRVSVYTPQEIEIPAQDSEPSSPQSGHNSCPSTPPSSCATTRRSVLMDPDRVPDVEQLHRVHILPSINKKLAGPMLQETLSRNEIDHISDFWEYKLGHHCPYWTNLPNHDGPKPMHRQPSRQHQAGSPGTSQRAQTAPANQRYRRRPRSQQQHHNRQRDTPTRATSAQDLRSLESKSISVASKSASDIETMFGGGQRLRAVLRTANSGTTLEVGGLMGGSGHWTDPTWKGRNPGRLYVGTRPHTSPPRVDQGSGPLAGFPISSVPTHGVPSSLPTGWKAGKPKAVSLAQLRQGSVSQFSNW